MANAGETAIVFIPESDATEHLIYRVEPTFPPLARDASIQGSVVLQIMIGEDGTIQHIKVVSGHPMLVPSAIEAVEKWRYEPFLEDEKPVAVDTRVTVEFSLPKK
jgi:protein TonB